MYLTGFGSFSRITDNPSWAIVNSFLEPAHQTITIPGGYTITFRAHPDAIKVSYSTVDALVPKLWVQHGEGWDYILHLGVGLEGGFELETQCWEAGYKLKDVDGCIPCVPGDDEGKKAVDMNGVHGSENENANKGEGRLLKTALDVVWVVDLVSRSVTVFPPFSINRLRLALMVGG